MRTRIVRARRILRQVAPVVATRYYWCATRENPTQNLSRLSLPPPPLPPFWPRSSEVCTYTYMYIYIYVFMYACTYVCVYVCIDMCVYMCVCIYIYIYMNLYVCMYIYIYVKCMYICLYEYICIRVFVWVHTVYIYEYLPREGCKRHRRCHTLFQAAYMKNRCACACQEEDEATQQLWAKVELVLEEYHLSRFALAAAKRWVRLMGDPANSHLKRIKDWWCTYSHAYAKRLSITSRISRIPHLFFWSHSQRFFSESQKYSCPVYLFICVDWSAWSCLPNLFFALHGPPPSRSAKLS